ncbi:MAG: arginine--tRNA ligase [Bacteroidales bacterium]|nr:arginine--tRNA ligase [Bacteroidales bacterium]MEE0909309.1 arginine--tRNA ligase [Bacteroidales bacterium]
MIDSIIRNLVSEAFDKEFGVEIAVEKIALSATKKEFEGDFTLVVFPFMQMCGLKNPVELANKLGAYVVSQTQWIESFNVIKGFLNFVVADSYWQNFLLKNYKSETFGYSPIREDKPVVVEYSSPNTNKPLHLGHIRNNLLGWSVAEILKANGYAVKKVNLVNDRGIHICKSMLAWKKFSDGETPQSSGMKGDHLVGKYYVAFDKAYKEEIANLVSNGMEKEEAEKNAPILLEAQAMLKRWEEKDAEVVDLWKQMNAWVYAGFDETYNKLGIDFDKVYYESETYLLGKDLVNKGLEQGVFYRREDGSVWIDLTKDGLDEKLLLRKDGTSVYMTQDLGTACLRHDDFGSERLVYVVGNEQNYHFAVLKLVLEKLGMEWAKDLYHLSYGMVELPNGKMKSREGTVVDADDLIAQMIETAKAQTEEHGKTEGFTSEQASELYSQLALGALKYFILKVDPKKNMLFNPEESIDFNGNTGPFIQYTHARIRSIIRKSENFDSMKMPSSDEKVEFNSKEKEVLNCLFSFPSVVRQAGETYSPSLIANFAFDLAKNFNAFYQDTPILRENDEAKRNMRLRLSYFTGATIKTAMHLLGIDVPERM